VRTPGETALNAKVAIQTEAGIVKPNELLPMAMNDSQRTGNLPDNPAQAFVDHFRCRPESAPFHLNGTVGQADGFFKLGESVCFGKAAGIEVAERASDALADVLPAIEPKLGGRNIRTPFNPTEIIDNLRRETYVKSSTGEHFFHTVYYRLRPLLPSALRIRLQRRLFHARQATAFPKWPMDDSVDTIFQSLMKLAIQAGPDGEVPFVWFWPEGKKAAVVMTHDVEQQAGVDECETLMDVDVEFGIKAAFHLIPEKRYPGQIENLTAHSVPAVSR